MTTAEIVFWLMAGISVAISTGILIDLRLKRKWRRWDKNNRG
jgi:hypothetical protein